MRTQGGHSVTGRARTLLSTCLSSRNDSLERRTLTLRRAGRELLYCLLVCQFLSLTGALRDLAPGQRRPRSALPLKSTYDWMDRVKGPFLVAKRVLTYPGLLRALASEALSLSLPLSSMLPFLPTQTCLFVSRSFRIRGSNLPGPVHDNLSLA